MRNKQSFFCYFDGAFLPLEDIALSPYDLGFLRGYAVFDVMPMENGKPFLWDRHFDRLCRSATPLGLSVPVTKEAYGSILDELIARNPGERLSFRTVLSGGPSQDSFVPQPGEETFLVLAEPVHTYPEEMFMKGVKAITLEYERPLPQVKLANHAIAISDLPRRREVGAFEAIYVSGGEISEASQSNVFIGKDGKLSTTWENVLHGITQGLVLELAEAAGIVAEKRGVSLAELLAADEVFMTGSSKRIVPVVQIDEMVIGGGIPGPVTRQLMEAFDEFAEKY
jgi:branched-subunit amino acid aminotransferase/4-amino-4-deoxychorismate lyase